MKVCWISAGVSSFIAGWLLRAILLDDHGPNDEDPCEWHGDGTRAEDEDWDGE